MMETRVHFTVINELKDLKNFQEASKGPIGVELPLDYLQRARVVALKSVDGDEIYGGFLMAYQGSLRCIEQIPDDVVKNNPVLQEKINRCFEINGLWLDHNNTPVAGRFRLYFRCMLEAIRLCLLGKTNYVYAYSAKNEKLRKFYSTFDSIPIYEGPVRALEGMEGEALEVVELGVMKRLPILLVKNPFFLVKRARRRRSVQAGVVTEV